MRSSPRFPSREGLTQDKAAEIAVAALSHLAGDPEAIGRFLAVSGIGPENLRLAAAEPGFLAGVLAYFLEDESLLLAFCESERLRPTLIAAARHALDPVSDYT